MEEILFALWFFFPAGIANMSPVFANNISALKGFTYPIDMGKKFRGKRILGDHKTFRGLISGLIGGILGGGLQILIYNNFSWVKSISDTIDYSNPKVLLIGAALGFGALVGDSIKSFFKRQIGIQPGHGWFPFDQLDFIIGGLLFASLFVTLPFSTYIIIAIVWLILHPVANILGWVLKLKDKPF
jgi:CDP-2,3-bis-(O-geranylgeranyl)-sn-glycerol synthase